MSEAHLFRWFPTNFSAEAKRRGSYLVPPNEIRGHYMLYEEAFNWKRQEKYMELTVL